MSDTVSPCATCAYIAPVDHDGGRRWYCDIERMRCAELFSSASIGGMAGLVREAAEAEKKASRWRWEWIEGDMAFFESEGFFLGWRAKPGAAQCPVWKNRKFGSGPLGTASGERVELVDVTFPARLRSEMTRLGIRVEDLALATGATMNSVSGWRTGKRMPHAMHLAAVAVNLDVTTDWLLGLED